MRFMMIVKHIENQGPPPKPLMDAIAKLAEEEVKAGTMLGTGGSRRLRRAPYDPGGKGANGVALADFNAHTAAITAVAALSTVDESGRNILHANGFVTGRTLDVIYLSVIGAMRGRLSFK